MHGDDDMIRSKDQHDNIAVVHQNLLEAFDNCTVHEDGKVTSTDVVFQAPLHRPLQGDLAPRESFPLQSIMKKDKEG